MKARLRNSLFAVLVASILLIPGASAAPTTTSLTFTCDRSVGSATATVSLQNSVFTTPFDTVTLTCGPDSISGLRSDRRKVSTGSAGFINYTIAITATVSGGCAGGSTVPAKVDCTPSGGTAGTTLVVR